jgi:tetratricopeptide (TPR) repeat protein
MRGAVLVAVAACATASGTPAAELDALHERLGRNAADPEAHMRLGLWWARAGDGLRAQQYLERAWQLGADPRRALPPLVRVDLALSSWEAALRHAEALGDILGRDCTANRSPGSCQATAETLAVTAALYGSLGHAVRARDRFEAAARADARLADAWIGLARIQTELGDRDAARDTLRRGLAAVGAGRRAAELRAHLRDLDREGGE